MDTQPDSLMDAGFWTAVLRSPTFWVPRDNGALAATLVLMLALLAGMVAVARRSARRRSLAALHGDQSGSTTMLDMVLVTPFFAFFMFLVFQFTILAKNHLFTHYAAYMAARSARVYICPFPISGGDLADRAMSIQVCETDDKVVQAKADLAARLALIPAAPYKPLACEGRCDAKATQVLKGIASATGVSSRLVALQRQARYMFDGPNVTVTVRTAAMAPALAIAHTPAVPVIATVKARFLLLDYAGWVFADGHRRDGRAFTTSTAEVSLL